MFINITTIACTSSSRSFITHTSSSFFNKRLSLSSSKRTEHLVYSSTRCNSLFFRFSRNDTAGSPNINLLLILLLV